MAGFFSINLSLVLYSGLSLFLISEILMKNFKLTLLAMAAACALLPVAAQAQLSFNVGAVSLYKSNGIDQDNRAPGNFIPALQGGVDYAFGNGFYLGNWNSTGKFGAANLEIDLYGGYGGEISQGLSYDVGFASYLYPDSGGGWNGNELYGSLSYGIFTTKLTWGTSGSIKEQSRLSLAIKQPLSQALTLTAGIGLRNDSNNGGASDYNLGLIYGVGNAVNVSATLSGADTNQDKAGDAGKARLVLGISKAF